MICSSNKKPLSAHIIDIAVFMIFFFMATPPAFPQTGDQPEAPKAGEEQEAGNPAKIDIANIESIFFSTDELEAINKAKQSYERKSHGGKPDEGVEEEDFLKKLENLAAPKKAQTIFTYPQFFLSSIVYNSASDWVLWINNEKITPASGISPSGLKVIEISKEKATLEWHPEEMDKVADIEGDPNKNPVKVDFINNKVIFTLRGNQTFTSYAMRIVEGKVLPITVNLNPDSTVSPPVAEAKK